MPLVFVAEPGHMLGHNLATCLSKSLEASVCAEVILGQVCHELVPVTEAAPVAPQTGEAPMYGVGVGVVVGVDVGVTVGAGVIRD
jgi:hypothetical protein